MALLVALGGVFLVSLLRQGERPFLERLFESPANLGPGHVHGCGSEGHPDGSTGHGVAFTPVHSHGGHHHAHGHTHGEGDAHGCCGGDP